MPFPKTKLSNQRPLKQSLQIKKDPKRSLNTTPSPKGATYPTWGKTP
jgi:hypothetical protein